MGDETPVNPPAPAVGSHKKKKDEKYRKRDPRSWENVMRTTANMASEERQRYLENIYNELYNENRTSYGNLQARDKQYTQCLREHEKDRAELTKSILARGQLESLCRELQKQNKLIKEENVARIKEEEERRREVANTFTERLNALTSLITESKDKSNKVKEENQNMTTKLTELYERYQQRENHLETVTRQIDLHKKLAETQAKKVEIEHEAETQTLFAQKKALELQLEQYERQIVLFQEKNRSLEAQVDLYKSQYSDFETTMSKSNKVFDTFKEEMSRMSKQLHTLEAERNDLRKRWQSSVNSLIALSQQHVALTNEQSALEKRLQMLQKLCRQLQEDRSAFLKQLKENNIEPIVPSLKNDDKENENEDQEAVASKNKSRAVNLEQDLEEKVKKATKMSDSDSSIIDGDANQTLKALTKRTRKAVAPIAKEAGFAGDQPAASPVEKIPAVDLQSHVSAIWSAKCSNSDEDPYAIFLTDPQIDFSKLPDVPPLNLGESNSNSSSAIIVENPIVVIDIAASSSETSTLSSESMEPLLTSPTDDQLNLPWESTSPSTEEMSKDDLVVFKTPTNSDSSSDSTLTALSADPSLNDDLGTTPRAN